MENGTGWRIRLAGAAGAGFGRAGRWLRPGRRDEAARLVAGLREQVLPVCSIAADSEARFLAFGHTARKLATLSDSLVEKSRQAIEMALGRHGRSDELMETVQLLQTALEAEAWNRDLTVRLIGEMHESGECVRDIRSVEAGLGKATAMLRVIGVLFRIESARLRDDVRVLFLDLSGRVSALENEVRESFGARFRAVEQTHETIVQTAEQIGASAEEAFRKTSETRGALENSLDAMTRQIAGNQSREVDLMELSRRLAGEVERIVIGLQSHDIISQKLAHLEGALRHIEAEEGSRERPEPLEQLRQFCRVESGQLTAVEGDLRAAIEALNASAAGILKEVEAVDENDGMLARFTRATSTTSEMVQLLLDGTSEVRQAVAASAAAGAESRRAIEPIAQALSGLDQAMTDVAVRMGLVALNAQVLAVQRGADTGLEVLAARTAQISAEAETLGSSVSRAAEEVALRIGNVAAGFAEAEQRMDAERLAIEEKGGECERRLHGMRDEMLACLQDLGATLDEMREATTTLVRDAGVLSEPLARLETARRALEETESAAARWLGTAAGRGRADWLAHGYTMSSEREVHVAALAGAAAAAPAACSPDAGEVELF